MAKTARRFFRRWFPGKTASRARVILAVCGASKRRREVQVLQEKKWSESVVKPSGFKPSD
jgi:hypothetical protein